MTVMKPSRSPLREQTWASKYSTVGAWCSADGGSVLDIGARDRVLRKHLQPGIEYKSLDMGPGCDYTASLESVLPFPDQSFDHVIALDVLEHVNSLHFAFAELCRIARSNVIIALPNMGHLRHRLSILRTGLPTTDKYRLAAKDPVDRHRWFTVYSEIYFFGNNVALAPDFRLARTCDQISGKCAVRVAKFLSIVHLTLPSLHVDRVILKFKRTKGQMASS